ncbi:hypothetical protein KAJ27_07720 [bacterium]|nr:hypothetical protein [bacterium]
MTQDKKNKKEVSENLLEFYSFLSATGWIFLIISALFMVYIKFNIGIFKFTDKISTIFMILYFSGFCTNVIGFMTSAIKKNNNMMFLSSSSLVAYFLYLVFFFKTCV